MVKEDIINANVLIAPGAIWNQLDAINSDAGKKQLTASPESIV